MPFIVGVIIQLLTLAHPRSSQVIDRPALAFCPQIKSVRIMFAVTRASFPMMILSKAHFNFWTSSYLNTHSQLAAARSPTPQYSRPMSALTNGDLSAARAAVSDQVKFDILTQTQEAVCAQCAPAGHGTYATYNGVRTMKRQGRRLREVSSVSSATTVQHCERPVLITLQKRIPLQAGVSLRGTAVN